MGTDAAMIFNRSNVVHFCKTKEEFGGFSNMCAGYPIRINGELIRTTEALYQACRFPDHPHLQQIIILQKSPMSAKMKSKLFREYTRSDWNEVRVDIMRWCLKVKLAFHFRKFGQLLESTVRRDIVELSAKDRFWGVVADKGNSGMLTGTNTLGCLLKELRGAYRSDQWENLLLVQPLQIDNFRLFDRTIEPVDQQFKVKRFSSK